MRLDDIFKNAERLKAPDSLKTRVMGEIEMEARRGGEERGGIIARVRRSGSAKQAAMALAAAAVLALAIRISPGELGAPPPAPGMEAELLEFAEKTYESVFPASGGAAGAAGARPEDDLDRFIETGLMEIFWINANGGAYDA